MATPRRVLGQVHPAANVDTVLYTVPDGGSAVISSFTVCNNNTGPITFRLIIDAHNEPSGDDFFTYFDERVPGRETFISTIGITVGSAGPMENDVDVIKVRADTTNVDFQLFGEESR